MERSASMGLIALTLSLSLLAPFVWQALLSCYCCCSVASADLLQIEPN